MSVVIFNGAYETVIRSQPVKSFRNGLEVEVEEVLPELTNCAEAEHAISIAPASK